LIRRCTICNQPVFNIGPVGSALWRTALKKENESMRTRGTKSQALKWTDRYSVKNAFIDNQHKGIFNLLNSLYDFLQNKESVLPITEIINQLDDYAVIHFRSEEQLMKAAGFPLLEEHRTQHDGYKKKVDELKSDFSEISGDMTMDLFVFLKRHMYPIYPRAAATRRTIQNITPITPISSQKS